MNCRRLIFRCLGFMLFAVPAGCNSLPPGPVESVATRPAAHTPRAGEAYLLRGWRGLWSEGVDTLAEELRSAGVDAMVFRADQAGKLAEALSRRYELAATSHAPLVLIGFSYGADDAIEVARKLNEHGIGVDLLVTIDPVTPPEVPANVKVCRNYYEPNGPWDALPWLRGIPLHEDTAGLAGKPGRLVNVNVRESSGGVEFAEPGTSHAKIAADPKLHRAILGEVLRVCPVRGGATEQRR